VLDRLWQTGEAPDHPGGLDELALTLSPDDPAALLARAQGEEVKALLRANTDAAAAEGLFGVPTCVVDGRAFWGLDALEMLADCLRGDDWFAPGGGWDEAPRVPAGTARQRPQG
jgi:2-hydroxychromene-2-carboxylate isomerase